MANYEPSKGKIVIYKAGEGPELKVKFEGETVWLTLQQIADLFGRDKSVVSRHLSAIFRDKELDRKATVAKNTTVQTEGARVVRRQIEYYNLDAIISVGYRVSSKKATQFRVWATQHLRDFLLKGYLINEKRLLGNQQAKLKELEGAHKLIQQALESRRLEGYERELLHIITDYANTWFVLNRYDANELAIENVSKRSPLKLDLEEVGKAIAKFKDRLIAKQEASHLFGQVVVEGKLQAVLGSIDQTFDGRELYPSVEEKAAHLLYFAIKDHPFADGNKRIGSLLFLLYLVENHGLLNRRGERKINDNALAALALLIAESKPEQKSVMVRLVVNLINKK